MPNDPTEHEIKVILADATRCEGVPARVIDEGRLPPGAEVFPSGHPGVEVVHEREPFAEGAGHATWSNGYDEGRRHGHKECHAEIARLRALLAASGVDADAHGGETR